MGSLIVAPDDAPLRETSLGQRATIAVGWATLTELVTRGFAPISLAVLARLLVPDEFGVVAAAAVVLSFAATVWQAGMPDALVQRDGTVQEVERGAIVVFWTNLGASIVLYLMIFVLADPLSGLFGDPRVAPVLRVQGLALPLGAMSATHLALFRRNLDYRPLFLIRASTQIAPALATIPLALVGFSYWSLTIGALTGSVLQVVVTWWVSPWRPKVEFDRELARQLGAFGAWAGGQAVLGWLVVWVDAVVVGAFLGSNDLGMYRTGAMLVASIFGVVLVPLQPVLFSAMSRLQHDEARLERAFASATNLVAALALPIGVGLAVTAMSLERQVLGDGWEGIGAVIMTLALVNAISWLIQVNTTIYSSTGRPDLSTKILLAALVLYVPSFMIAATYGIEVLLLTRAGVAVAGFALQVAVAKRVLGFGLVPLMRSVRAPATACAVMAAVALAIEPMPLGGWGVLAAQVILGALAYGLVLRMLSPALVSDMVSKVRGIMSRPT